MFRHILWSRQLVKLDIPGIHLRTSKLTTSQRRNKDDQKDDQKEDPNANYMSDPNHPMTRIINAFKYDMSVLRQKFSASKEEPEINNFDGDIPLNFPVECDVIVIGGGIIGSCIAYWLKKTALGGLRVIVVEKDPTYRNSSSFLSGGCLRQQFSLEENIEMSLFGANFIRETNVALKVDGAEPLDVNYHPYGQLCLASEDWAEAMENNCALQNSLGAKNVIYTLEKLQEKFPWINLDGVALGCYGLQNSGWFNSATFLYALKRKALNLGAEYITAEALGFEFDYSSSITMSGIPEGEYFAIDKLVVRTQSGKTRSIKFALAVAATGVASGTFLKNARIGEGPGILSVPLPIEPRKRYEYYFHCSDGPGLNTPMTIDPSGVYFRRVGLAGHYVVGRSPAFKEHTNNDLESEQEFFKNHIRPILKGRVKGFENLELKHSWSHAYDYNNFDNTGILGMHPYYHNLYIATGFTGYGAQHAPAVAQAITDLIVDARFTKLNLARLSFDRLITLEPIVEEMCF